MKKKTQKPSKGIQDLFVAYKIDSESPWFEQLASLLENQGERNLNLSSINKEHSDSLRQRAELLIKDQEKKFTNSLSSEFSFYLDLLEKGTQSDKLSAYGFLVGKAPPFFISKLSNWMSWVSTGISRAESINEVLISMVQVFSNYILPPNRKLKFIEQRSIPSLALIPDPQLWAWAIEDTLKRAFADLILLLEKQLHTPYENLKLSLLPILSNLLVLHPEQESAILSLLILKLEDSSKKVASTAGRLILKVVLQHPAMSEVIVNAIYQKGLLSIKDQAIKSTSALHARYYGIILLTQIPLDKRFLELSKRLIAIYIRLIKELYPTQNIDASNRKRKFSGEDSSLSSHEEKILSLLLRGLHSAYLIYRDGDLSSLDILFKLAHIGSWSKSIEALWLLFRISKVIPETKPRFQRLLYESLLDNRSLSQGRKQAEQYSLLLKKYLTGLLESNYTHVNILLAFIKRLLRSISFHPVSHICSFLQVILEIFTELAKVKIPLKSLIIQDKAVGLGPIKHNSYDPWKRDPQWSGITINGMISCSFFEICPFIDHWHPSVAILAKAIIVSTKGISIKNINPINILENATPNPFESYSINSFLDRWAHKNPKQRQASKPSCS